jgi:transcriptional regulator with XRE-family HTH domain
MVVVMKKENEEMGAVTKLAKKTDADGAEGLVPNRIKEWRMKRGLSLSEMSELTGLTRSELHKLEKGVRRLRTDHLPVLSKALRCDPEELLAPELAEQLLGNRLKYGGGAGNLISSENPTIRADLPILGSFSAEGRFISDENTPQAFAPRPPQLVNVKGAYAIYMPTTRMEPRVPVASMLYVNPVLPARPGDLACVRLTDGRTEIVAVERGKTGLVGRLSSPDETIELDPESGTKVHRVTGVIFA